MQDLNSNIKQVKWFDYLSEHIGDQEKIDPNYLSALIGSNNQYYFNPQEDSVNYDRPSDLNALCHLHLIHQVNGDKYTFTSTTLGTNYIKLMFKNRTILKFVNMLSFLWSMIFVYLGINKNDGNDGLAKYITILTIPLAILTAQGTTVIEGIKTFYQMGLFFPFVLSVFAAMFTSDLNVTGVRSYNKPLCKWLIKKNPKCTKGYFLRFLYEHSVVPTELSQHTLDDGIFHKKIHFSIRRYLCHIIHNIITFLDHP